MLIIRVLDPDEAVGSPAVVKLRCELGDIPRPRFGQLEFIALFILVVEQGPGLFVLIAADFFVGYKEAERSVMRLIAEVCDTRLPR